jgi:hypothetical protein
LLYVEAAVCFGPLAAMLSFGVLLFPLWTGMLLMHLSGAIAVHDPDGLLAWHLLWPMLVVASGVIGLVGLFRVLLLLSREARETRGRALTLWMVLIGWSALISLNFQEGEWLSLHEEPIAALVCWALPAFCSAHVLYLARRPLFGRRTR